MIYTAKNNNYFYNIKLRSCCRKIDLHWPLPYPVVITILFNIISLKMEKKKGDLSIKIL